MSGGADCAAGVALPAMWITDAASRHRPKLDNNKQAKADGAHGRVRDGGLISGGCALRQVGTKKTPWFRCLRNTHNAFRFAAGPLSGDMSYRGAFTAMR